MTEILSWDSETGEEIFPPEYNPLDLVTRLKEVDWSKSPKSTTVRHLFMNEHIRTAEVVDSRTGLPYHLSSNQKLLDLDEQLWRDGIIPGYGHRIHNLGWVPSPLLALRSHDYDAGMIHALFANYDPGYYYPGGTGLRYIMVLPKATREAKVIANLFVEPEPEEEILFQRLLGRILPPVKELE